MDHMIFIILQMLLLRMQIVVARQMKELSSTIHQYYCIQLWAVLDCLIINDLIVEFESGDDIVNTVYDDDFIEPSQHILDQNEKICISVKYTSHLPPRNV